MCTLHNNMYKPVQTYTYKYFFHFFVHAIKYEFKIMYFNYFLLLFLGFRAYIFKI